MTYNSSSCFLYDPYYKRKYTVFDNKELLADALTLDARYGWVLLYKKTTSAIFFYNPFTNDPIIELPQNLDCFHAATFSCAPDSPYCLIFLFSAPPFNRIRICKPGDKSWTKFQYNAVSYRGEDLFPFPDVQYVNGVLYCCFSKKAIGVFNVARKEWKTYPYKSGKGLEKHLSIRYLIECNGNLLMAHYCDRVLKWRLLRYDPSEMNWFEVEKLDNGALFIGEWFEFGWYYKNEASCVGKRCIYIPEPASENLSNTVHNFDGSCNFDCRGCPWYKSYQDHSSCNRIYDDLILDDSSEKGGYLYKVWIHPPQPQLKL